MILRNKLLYSRECYFVALVSNGAKAMYTETNEKYSSKSCYDPLKSLCRPSHSMALPGLVVTILINKPSVVAPCSLVVHSHMVIVQFHLTIMTASKLTKWVIILSNVGRSLTSHNIKHNSMRFLVVEIHKHSLVVMINAT